MSAPAITEERFPCPRSAELATHHEQIVNLQAWEEKQNGSLNRLGDKIDALRDELNAMRNWIMVTLGAALLALIGVIGQLLRSKG